MTSEERIKAILGWVQTSYIDWNFMRLLKQDLEGLVEVAHIEGAINLLDQINELADRSL